MRPQNISRGFLLNCLACRAPNPEGALHCVRCGAILVDDGATVVTPGEAVAAKPGRMPAAAANAASAAPMPTLNSAAQHGQTAVSDSAQGTVDFGARYRVEGVLGEGGMGTVYKAWDKELERMVALKLVRSDLTRDPGAAQRFKQELLLASKISHRNILRIHDLGDAPGGTKFISMAYIEGEDLHSLLQREGKLPLARAVNIARQLCEALEAAHAEGVVHRDLKPQNILVNKSDHIFVSDFGLAKSLESDLSMTRTGQFLGTPRYMSPEQAEGKPVDHRSDIYAFGLILCEMLTGDVPFAPAASALQIMFQRVQETPRDPRELNPELPEYIGRIIQKCLERDVARRYQNAREILEDLDAARAPAVSSSTGTRTVQISLPVVNRRMGYTAVIVLALLLAGVFAVPWSRNLLLHRGRAAPQAESPPQYIAVLPFRVIGDEKSVGYVAEGIEDALAAKLFQFKDVRVTSGAAARKIDPQQPLQKIGQELGANLVVRGTLQSSADKIRVIVSLDNVASGKTVWSQEFSGVPQDLLTLEDQMYARLVSAMALKLSNAELASATAHPTDNVEAYDLYLRGRDALRKQQDLKNVKTAIDLFEKAVVKDPSFALAYTGIADASLRMYHENKEAQWAQRAVSAVQQAQGLNDKLPQVLFSAGDVYIATGKSAEAIAELTRAVQLAPNSDDGYRRLGRAYAAVGRTKEAIAAYQKAVEINPYYWFNYNELGLAYYGIGDFENTAKMWRRVIELDPSNADGYNNLGAVYLQTGKFDQAVDALNKALKYSPSADTYTNLGTAYYYLHDYEKAIQFNQLLYDKSFQQ
jgi:tetratricopeptide (TPR) repeat protein/predicted Ser/Thr protein kinase